MKQRGWWILVGLWFTACASGLGYYSISHIQTFDPHLTLNQAAAGQDFDKQLSATLAQAAVLPGTLLHIRPEGECYCDTLARTHLRALGEALPSYSIKSMSVSSLPGVSRWLTRLPALALLDKNGEVRYLGPYALGAGCFSGNTLETRIIALANSSLRSPGAVVISDATGCFCDAA
ncbi:DUF6436 domain-containing protein [Salinimonas chungwhensis]|uniref:DUF6436 domain-containing protein n=1 Tax=Salinimonas chungwhensis TaxID=265425 RepID=UPI00035ED06D|nr:DUF6436 domain-containing protein [Salinimonas chungwhensis]